MFDDIKREMSKTCDILNILYSDLGLLAYKNNVNLNDSLFDQIAVVYSEKKKLEDSVNTLSFAQKTLETSNSKALTSKLDSLLCSLGAICSEIDKNGQMPEPLVHCMSHLHDYDAKHSSLVEKAKSKNMFKTFWNNKLEKHTENEKKAFYLTGKAVINSGKGELLPSLKATNIIHSISDLKIQLSHSRKDSANAKASIKEVSKDTALDSKLSDAMSRLDAICLDYGKELALKLDELKSNSALEKVCSKIEKEQKHLVRLNLNMENLEVENEIVVHEKLACQYQEQLDFLNKRVKEVSDKLEVEQQAITLLKNKGQDFS